MALYTFFLEYRGGTYIAQVRASSPTAGVRKWAKSLDYEAVEGMSREAKEELVRYLHEGVERPVPIDGVQRTWCCTASPGDHFALINFVETAGD